MSYDLSEIIERRQRENLALHREHINPQFARVLRTIGFDRSWTRAEGAYLWDADGRQYLDFLSGYGVFNIGRNHPVVAKTLKDFIDHQPVSLVQMEAPLLSGLLAEELKKLVPPHLSKVYFTNSGTEGVETALKYARRATGRARVLYCDHGYHGLTYGALSVNGEKWFRDGFDPLLPDCDPIALNDLEGLRAELDRGDVAALIVEPVQGKGVYVADDEFLRSAAALLREKGALLILDEVQTGFGRTGKMFAREHSGVEPDILVVSKALSGGFVPVGAVFCRDEIYASVFRSMEECVVHSSTFGQGAFAMAAGLATLHVLESEGIVENSRVMGEKLLEGLQALASRYELVKEVRGRGCMIGIEFGRPKSFKLKMGWDLVHKLNDGLFGQAIVMPLFSDHGILTQVAGHGRAIVKLIPPLVLTEADVSRFLEAFDDVLAKCHRFPGPIWEVTSRLAKHALKA